MRVFEARSIEWHEECLENQRKSLERTLRNLRDLEKSVERQTEIFNHYKSQIERAKRLGKKSFDPDKFKGV